MTDAPPPPPPLAAILGVSAEVHVVDIGANPVDGHPPYKILMDQGIARVIGFEPNSFALAKLNQIKGPHETYVGSAVGDGGRHTLNLCQAQGMTSLLNPNHELYKYFHGLSDWGRVTHRLPVETVRLDDVAEITRMDYLKIDIQGGELDVFRHGTARLADCLVIQTEVEFLPLYEGQPLFSEVEQFLRAQGFWFHRFWPLRTRTIKPMMLNNDIHEGLAQVTDGDAVFVRDFTKLDRLRPEQLLGMATIMHDVYRSFDLVLRALMQHDRATGSRYAAAYTGRPDFPLD